MSTARPVPTHVHINFDRGDSLVLPLDNLVHWLMQGTTTVREPAGEYGVWGGLRRRGGISKVVWSDGSTTDAKTDLNTDDLVLRAQYPGPVFEVWTRRLPLPKPKVLDDRLSKALDAELASENADHTGDAAFWRATCRQEMSARAKLEAALDRIATECADVESRDIARAALGPAWAAARAAVAKALGDRS